MALLLFIGFVVIHVGNEQAPQVVMSPAVPMVRKEPTEMSLKLSI